MKQATVIGLINLFQFISTNYKNTHLDNVARRIRELWGFTSISTTPIEQHEGALDERIKNIAKHYWAVHKERLSIERAQ